MLKNPYIVSWVPDRIKLSDGATHREFQDHDEAIAFLEEEMRKCTFPIATIANKQKHRQEYGKEPVRCQMECSRLQRGIVYLYGASEIYIIPDEVGEPNFDV